MLNGITSDAPSSGTWASYFREAEVDADTTYRTISATSVSQLRKIADGSNGYEKVFQKHTAERKSVGFNKKRT